MAFERGRGVSARIVAGIQARCSSARLPGKVLADLEGKPLILRVVERARAAALVDEVVVLTSVEPSDDPLVELLERERVSVRRGALADVLGRYIALVDEFDPTFVVRVTGDCPLIEPDFIDLQLGALSALDADFVRVACDGPASRGGYEGTLAGQAAFSTRALRRATESSDPRDREHVGSFYFKAHADEFRHVEIEMDEDYFRDGLRLCVDEPADLALARCIFARFGDAPFQTLDAIRWLDVHPEVVRLNRGVTESADNQAYRRISRDTRVPVVGRWP